MLLAHTPFVGTHIAKLVLAPDLELRTDDQAWAIIGDGLRVELA